MKEPNYEHAIYLIDKLEKAIQLFNEVDMEVRTCNVPNMEWHVYKFEDFKWLCQSLNKVPVTTKRGDGDLRWPYRHDIEFNNIVIYCITSKEDGE